LAVPERDIEAHAQTFRCMLGLIRGRVYYNLLNWYRVLSLLPGFGLNRGFMEQMMGVRRALPEELVASVLRERRPGSRWLEWLNVGRGVAALAGARWRLPATIRAFYARLNTALNLDRKASADRRRRCEKCDLDRKDGPRRLETMRLDELAAHFRELERQLVTRWDAPLINDFFAMIFFGVLRKLCAKWLGDELQANALIVASGEIISAEPARRIRAMAESIRGDGELIAALESAPANVPVARRALAREMGIPCAVGVPGATRWIADGEAVELDGACGTVKRVRGGE
jgi:pyruvate,water dikinase